MIDPLTVDQLNTIDIRLQFDAGVVLRIRLVAFIMAYEKRVLTA